jgi:hypothetical protein
MMQMLFLPANYDKSFIHTTKIRQVVIEVFIQGENSSKHVLDFDKTGLLNKQTILDSSGKKVNEYFFIYNRQADQVERKNIDYQLNKTLQQDLIKCTMGHC